PKIDDHSQFNMLDIGNGSADYRNGKLIAMPVYIPTFTVVPIQGMPCFKIKLLGNANFAHNPILRCKGNSFLETNYGQAGTVSLPFHISYEFNFWRGGSGSTNR